MKFTTTLTFNTQWDDEERHVEKLEITDEYNNQTVILTRASPADEDAYTYSSKLVGDDAPVAADRTFTFAEGLGYAMVNLGISPDV